MTGADRPLVVVLGASGFVGSAVTKVLSELPVRVRAVARRPMTMPEGVEAHQADLTRPGMLAEAVADADAVLPFAARIRGAAGWRVAEDDDLAERTHVGLIRDLVAALSPHRGVPPVVVFPGSNTQVGKVAGDRVDGTEEDHPEGVYDRQKLTAERLLKDANRQGRLRATSLRLPPVFGAPAAPTTDDRGVVSTMIRRALAGEPLTMWHDGTVRRDLLYVEDAARAFVAALDHVDRLAGRHYPVGSGQAAPLVDVFGDIAEAVARATGAPPVPVVSVPPPPQADGTDFRSVRVDPFAFVAATGWRPLVPWGEALARTVAALATVR
ncbi:MULTISPECIES: NAD(P)-dependent oxidoreductase [unclassified Streptomyces]|uniref:NAD-dependent epimerase/dehydratase family protein n=1 Tax=unclassified Streptomyces TaxID=2593676 RepID=UPI000CD53646|nr:MULTISPECIES: NAD-dependent epimerase/dehydratase [unclassified Streptomyces]AWL41297.1 SDR family NAD-dependent epimerase/dehydratase [Streptomyces sp. SM18]